MEGLLSGMSSKLPGFKAAAAANPAPSGAGAGRPTSGRGEAPRRQQLHNYTRKTLGMGFIRQAVQLPPGVAYAEWLALHTQDFFDSASLLVSIVADERAPRLEPGFGFPPGYEYLWMDPRTKRPIKCSGPEYIEHVLSWVDSVLNDERLFPRPGTDPEAYPRDFEKTAKAVFKRLFRVWAILYTHHYSRMDAMGAVAHLNTSFKHFMFFCFEFDLVQQAEMEAIDTLVERLRQEYKHQQQQQPPQGAAAISGSGAAADGSSTGGGGGTGMAPLP